MELAETPNEIARRVRKARSEAQLRQDELAFAAGVSTRLVHEIEAGKPTLRLDGLIKVLGALGLSLEIVNRPLRRELPALLNEAEADGE
jgi:HTH-type transcriptional regulator / antitoxin HipB